MAIEHVVIQGCWQCEMIAIFLLVLATSKIHDNHKMKRDIMIF